MEVKVSFILFPDLIAISALIMLTAYHVMIYLGRKRDRKEKYNLYFAGFIFSFVLIIIAPYFRKGYFLDAYRPHWLYVINIEMIITWLVFFTGISFFNHLLEVSSSYRKKFRLIFITISLNVLLTLTSNFIGIDFYFRHVLIYVLTIVGANVLLMNFLFGYWIYSKKLYKEKFIGILYAGYALLTFNMLIYRFIELTNYPHVVIPYHYLTVFILYLFAYAFSVKLNKEHHELKELKFNLTTQKEQQILQPDTNVMFTGNETVPVIIVSLKCKTSGIDEQFLQKAIQIVEKNLNIPDFNTKKFCEEIGISHAHLYRRLKALTNQSASEFIRGIRLKHAAELLNQKSASISEIAYDTGFNNLSYFTYCFKEKFGVVPSEFFSKSNGEPLNNEVFS